MALTTSLSAFYEFESGALTTDATANALTLTNNNTVTSVTGKVGNAGSFVGASSQSLSHVSDTLYQPAPDFSIQAWIKYNTISGQPSLVTKGDLVANSLQYNLFLYDGDSKIYFRVFDTLLNNTTATSSATSSGTFYHVIATYDSSDKKARLYIDGAAAIVGSALAAGVDAAGAGVFSIGKATYGIAYYLDGLLDQVGFWKRALTSSEVTSLYNAGSGLSYAAMAGGTNTLPLVGDCGLIDPSYLVDSRLII